MVSRSPGLAVTLNSKACPGQMLPTLRALSSSSTRFDPTKSKAYPALSDVDLPRKWPWEDHGKTSKVPRFLGAPTRELSAPVGSPMAERGYSRRPLLANAAIAASRVGS